MSRSNSDAVIPAYFAFRLLKVASDTPCRRRRALVFAPASASFSTAMVCYLSKALAYVVRSGEQTILADATKPALTL